jgi:hypothetical protein
VSAKIKAAWLWCWSHRTKAIGGFGTAASYAYLNQDKLGLFIPARNMGFTMGAIGVATFGVGLYNTFFKDKDKDKV